MIKSIRILAIAAGLAALSACNGNSPSADNNVSLDNLEDGDELTDLNATDVNTSGFNASDLNAGEINAVGGPADADTANGTNNSL